MAKRNKNDDAIIGYIAFAILCLILMPFVGVALILSKDPEKKSWGWVMLIVGLVLLLVLGLLGG